ncbi:MAG: aspartate/glutamate racemase family protein [Pseudomonadales bacterium]
MSQNQPHIGILMLNTRFARPVGDIGNLASYRYRAQIHILESANVANIVVSQLAPALIDDVVAAAQNLERQGANIITTSCGFLAPIQQRVQSAIRSPFLASSLSLMPFLRQAFGPSSKVGVLTFDSRVLTPNHFNGLYDENIAISGIEHGCELHRVIKGDIPELDQARALEDVLHAAEKLQAQQVSCILLECTNLSPYKAQLRAHFGLPVFDLVDAIHWLADAKAGELRLER